MRRSFHRRRARGSALFTVLAVVAIASMLGAMVMTAGDASATATERYVERMELRAAAWSGVQTAMAELGAQRRELLNGQEPTLTVEIPLAEEGAERPIVRLLAWEPDGADPASEEKVYASPEAAKLDLNRADAAMLAALGVPETAAGEILARRGSRPFTSVEELATLASLGVADVMGAQPAKDAQGPLGSPTLPPLALLFTTLSFDPNVQAGLASSESAGKLRINIGRGWSDEVAKVLTDQLGQGAADAVKKLVEQTKSLDGDAALAAALLQQGTPKELMPAALDLLTVSDDLYVPGRVDLTRARPEVLAAIPGIGKDKAQAIAAARGQLSEDERRSRAWPYTRGLLTPEEFGKALPWITSRTMQWRVRLTASVERAGGSSGPAEPATVLRSASYEAVIDVSSDRPRLAYWREITLMPIARAMEKRVSALARSITESKPAAPAASEEEPAPPPQAPPAAPPSGEPPQAPTTPPPATDDGGMKDRRTGRWKGGST